ncbi:OmpA family protein [Palleronia sp. KMU-117]|uniref:OmpA family protein n=1 Tax=Palleronia sp. KMU-117 TaxID=3434108 RepID=UPI003D71E812
MPQRFMIAAVAACLALPALAQTALAQTALAQTECPAISLGPADGLPVYEGACLIGGDEQAFAAFALPTGPAVKDGDVWRGEREERLEGRYLRRLYAAPEGRSPLEVVRNYRDALTAAGFTVLFECSGADCGRNEAMGSRILWTQDRRLETLGDLSRYAFTGLSDDHYLAARSADGSTSLGLYVARNNFKRFPETFERAILHLDIVQTRAMEARMIDAAAMRTALDDTGRIALDNIYFDFGTSVLTPESAPALDEMAKLLFDAPEIGVYIVGHTDNVGSFEANLVLSRERAEAVVEALAARGIARDRIVPAGVAALSPVASNATETGRQMNRRVEMVMR